jgi:hypothetical protein
VQYRTVPFFKYCLGVRHSPSGGLYSFVLRRLRPSGRTVQYQRPDDTMDYFNKHEGHAQGDPLDPLLSCLAFLPLLKRLNSSFVTRGKARLAAGIVGDDNCGSVTHSISNMDYTSTWLHSDDLYRYLTDFQRLRPKYGLHLSLSKTSILTTTLGSSIRDSDSDHVAGIPTTPHEHRLSRPATVSLKAALDLLASPHDVAPPTSQLELDSLVSSLALTPSAPIFSPHTYNIILGELRQFVHVRCPFHLPSPPATPLLPSDFDGAPPSSFDDACSKLHQSLSNAWHIHLCPYPS